MVQTIFHDAILNFGKHKGRPAMDIARSDPGYLLWCQMSGTRKLDAALSEIVAAWVDKNPRDVRRIEYSAEKARAKRGQSRSSKTGAATQPEAEIAPPAKPAASEAHAAWGSW